MAFQEGSTDGEFTGTDYRTIVPAPSGTNTRIVKLLHILNQDTGDVNVELFINSNGSRVQFVGHTMSTYQAFEWQSPLVLNSPLKSIDGKLVSAPAVSQPTFVTSYADAIYT
jgi:hypothetical protein